MAIVMHFRQAGRTCATLPGTEEALTTTIDCITAFFGQVDAHLPAIPTHPEAHLWPREGGTLGLLRALTGGGHRACVRWLPRDSRALGPRLPERPRLLRLLQPHQDGPRAFLATPTGLGVIDPYGIDRIPPRRAGRSPQPLGRKGLAHHRGRVGGTRGLVLHQWGGIVGGACAPAQVADQPFPWRMRQVDGRMMVWRETGFHATAGDPAHLPVGPRGA